MRKKVCLIAHLNDLSGANKALIDLASGLNRDNDVVVIVPRSGALKNKLVDMNIRVCVIPSATWVYKKDEKLSKRMIKRIVNISSEFLFFFFFIKEQFDVIHYNSITYGCGARAANMLKIPYTWHIRELAEENFSLTFFNRNAAISLVNKSRRIITISNFMKEAISGYIHIDKLCVVYDGITVSMPNYNLLSNGYELSDEIIFIGAIARDKGQLDAIEALKLLINKGYKYHINFVGQITDKKYYEELLLAIDSDIVDYIHFSGYTSNVSKYRDPRCLVLVCSPSEAFGLVTVEAMMAGQVVIGANGGATKEIIVNGESGFLYESGNPKELCDCIITLKDKNLSDISNKAQERVYEFFNIENTIKKMDKIFDLCIKRK